jgi:hypothetical protein
MNDKEWKIFNINKSIDKLYEQSGFFDKYGLQFLITIAIIVLFVFTFTYISILNNLAPIKKNWPAEKCNPLYMPFAGFINNDSKTKTNLDYTLENFNTCIGIISEDIADTSLDPIKFMTDAVTTSFSGLTGVFQNLTGFFSAIIATISVYVKEAYYTLLNSTISFVRVAEAIKDTFGKLTGIITTAMYSQIMMMNLTFLWMAYMPVKSATWALIGATVSLILALVLVEVLSMLTWIPFFGIIALAAMTSEILIIAVQTILIVLCTIWLIIIQAFTDRVMTNLTSNNVPMLFS